MANYDSILKEKKKYEESIKSNNNEQKPFPWLKIDILCLTILLVISYFFYYTIILNPKQIFLNDLKTIINKYQTIIEPVDLDKLNNKEYSLKGTVIINDKNNYNFELARLEEQINLDIIQNNNQLKYHANSNQKYIKISSFKDEYIKLINSNNSNIISNLRKYLNNNLTKDKFIKKFYLNGTSPIVESNLILNNQDLNKALGLNNKEESQEVLFTFKNHALTNEIISLKLTINNLTNNKRSVILYEHDKLTYKDDKQNIEFILETNNKDFSLKIYKEKTLFSVLTGNKKESSYEYVYQIIDKFYNIKVNLTKENNAYHYEISSFIEKEGIINEEKTNINIQYDDESLTENIEKDNIIDYKNLTDDEIEKYKASLKEIIKPLKEFINKYK